MLVSNSDFKTFVFVQLLVLKPLTRVVFVDADIPHAGPTVISMSQCCSAETGQTGGTAESHLHHQGTNVTGLHQMQCVSAGSPSAAV